MLGGKTDDGKIGGGKMGGAGVGSTFGAGEAGIATGGDDGGRPGGGGTAGGTDGNGDRGAGGGEAGGCRGGRTGGSGGADGGTIGNTTACVTCSTVVPMSAASVDSEPLLFPDVTFGPLPTVAFVRMSVTTTAMSGLGVVTSTSIEMLPPTTDRLMNCSSTASNVERPSLMRVSL